MADQAGTSSAQATASGRPSERDDGGYHVFLNFRGPDTRLTVTDALRDTLTRAGLRVFYDDEEIRKGEQIAGEIFSAIANSKICITIFSRDYASSKWCLRELAYMVDLNKKLEDGEKKVILPVFWDVDAADVKLNTELYDRPMRKHEEESGEVVAKQWKEALGEVARIKGFKLKPHGMVKLLEEVKAEVFNQLKLRETPDSSSLVGIHDQLDAIVNLLELDNGSLDPKFIVIHGIGGIGKTTIASYIFKKFSSHFQGSCILFDVRRQSSSVDDVVKLQKKLLSDTLHITSIEVLDINDGAKQLSERLRNQRTLIVLDDVDERKHLVNLAAKSSWFGSKSRIIITTRNIDFLPQKYSFYEMKKLKHDHALQLFYRHAFEDGFPPGEYYDIASKIVATTGGLPLALEVIGASLCNQVYGTWEKRLEELKNGPHKDVKRSLMISYHALEEDQQQIFLDIACFFSNESKVDPILFWKARGPYTDSRIDSVIDILVRRSMIRVIDNDMLWMHDQLRDLGREIAQEGIQYQGCTTPIEPSRLWSPKVALDVIRKRKGNETIVAVELGILDTKCHFVPEEFARLVNLSFLQLYGGKLKGDFRGGFQKLIWLSWFNCPLKFQGINVSFDSLVILRLSWNSITDAWGGWYSIKAAKNLKILELTRCPRRMRTPKFSKFPTLERLILNDCEGVEEIHWSISESQSLKFLEISNQGTQVPRPRLLPKSIGGLKSLTTLNIRNAGLTKLPGSFGKLGALKHLSLRYSLLRNLPSTIGNLRSLLQLDISFSKIEKLPDSLGNLIKLATFSATGSALSHLPESFGKLTSLNVLYLSDSRIVELPMTIGGLESLNELDLSRTRIIELPTTIGKLERLKVLRLVASSIKKLPKDIGDACSLEELDVSSCSNMKENIPEEIGKLSSLRRLNLLWTPIRSLPASINGLSYLQELHLGNDLDNFDEQLPKLPESLLSLIIYQPLYLGMVPDLSNLTNLVTLKVQDWFHGNVVTNEFLETTSKVEWLVRLTKLEELQMVLPNLALPPIDLSSLSRLRKLEITCFDLQHLSRLPPSLEEIILHKVKSAIEIDCPQFSGLKNVFTFKLQDYRPSELHVNALGELENLCMLYVDDAKQVKKVSGLSCLKNLKVLYLWDCQELIAIQGLENCTSLENLCLQSCTSLTSVPDVANKESCILFVGGCAGLGGHFSGLYHHFALDRTVGGRASEDSGSRKRRRPKQMNRASRLRKRRWPTLRMCRSYLFNLQFASRKRRRIAHFSHQN